MRKQKARAQLRVQRSVRRSKFNAIPVENNKAQFIEVAGSLPDRRHDLLAGCRDGFLGLCLKPDVASARAALSMLRGHEKCASVRGRIRHAAHPAQRFMRPAWDAEQMEVLDGLKKAGAGLRASWSELKGDGCGTQSRRHHANKSKPIKYTTKNIATKYATS